MHHFAFLHPRTTLLYDARSYLTSTTAVAQFMQSVLHGHPDTSFISGKDFIAAIVNDGPVLTGTFGAIFSVFNHVPQNKDWSIFEIIQSVMHALSATCIYLSARRAVKVEGAALFAGALWATYPAAIVASGRYYNEPLMILLLVAGLYFASARPVSARGQLGQTTLGSYFSGLVFLMKPALVAGAGVAYLCMLLGSKKKLAGIIAIALGVIMTFAPWAIYTKNFMGKAYFTTPRNSSYNFAMGNDTDVDGVLTSPMPPLTTAFVNDPQPVHFMFAQWSSNMPGYLTMLARKVTRMYAHPWNDFRHTYFGLNAHLQQYWHWVLLFCGLSGLLLFAGETLKRSRLDYDKNSVFFISLGWLAAPTFYLLFEANSRYGFSLTPFLAVFAALPVARLIESTAARSAVDEANPLNEARLKTPLYSPALAIAITLAGACTLLIVNADKITRIGQSSETSHELAPHAIAIKTLTLTPEKEVKGARLFVMVDGDVRLEKAQLSVNGQPVADGAGNGLKHLRYFYPSKYSEYYVFQELGYSMNQLPADYRQYYMVEIPTRLVNWHGENKIELRAPDNGLLVYGESDPKTRHYLSPLYFTPIQLGNSSLGLETRVVMPELKAAIAQGSATDDGAGHKDILADSLRINLVAADRLEAGAAARDVPTNETNWTAARQFDLQAKDFDRCFSTGVPGELHTSRHVVDAAHSVCAEFTLPRSAGSNAIKLRLTGLVKALRPKSKVGLLLASKNKAGLPVLVSNTPPYLTAGPQWTPFAIDDIVPGGELAPGPLSMTVGIYPGPWEEICGYSCDKTSADAVIKDLKLELAPAYQLDLSPYRLIIY